MSVSDDEGANWNEPRELPISLTGDRHTNPLVPPPLRSKGGFKALPPKAMTYLPNPAARKVRDIVEVSSDPTMSKRITDLDSGVATFEDRLPAEEPQRFMRLRVEVE